MSVCESRSALRACVCYMREKYVRKVLGLRLNVCLDCVLVSCIDNEGAACVVVIKTSS